ncbi:SpoIIE family protein phosphatase [Gammaproteobacteria bacterium AS21]
MNSSQLEYFVATRSLESLNGDAAFIVEDNDELFIFIFDGAGHGESAHNIAIVAVDFIKKNRQLDLVNLMSALHDKLKGSDGGVAVIAKFNMITRQLYYVGIGNIFLRVFSESSKREITQGGVIGYQIRSPKEKSIAVATGSTIVFHTDGITSRFNESDYPNILWDDVQTVSQILLDKFGKNNDDATCAVIRV